jgi:hypothetical protein
MVKLQNVIGLMFVTSDLWQLNTMVSSPTIRIRSLCFSVIGSLQDNKPSSMLICFRKSTEAWSRGLRLGGLAQPLIGIVRTVILICMSIDHL